MNQQQENLKDDYILNDKEYNLAKMEMKTIVKAKLKFPYASNQTIAGLLGISDRSLYRKIKRYGLNGKNQFQIIKQNS